MKNNHQQRDIPIGAYTHKCQDIQDTIDSYTHEADLILYFNEECEEDPKLDFWTIYHDGQSEYYRLNLCPWCGVRLRDPRT